jgi:hypothetical protein
MESNRARNRWASIAAVALLGLAVVPVLAGTGAAAPVAPTAAAAPSASWAYGGEAWSNGGFTLGSDNFTWNTSFGLVAIFSANNTSATTIELTEQRTVAVNVRASLTGPSVSWSYNLHAVESMYGFANLTRVANVTLGNGSTVNALGLENAAAHANATLAESRIGTFNNTSYWSYLNVSGRAALAASFAPALGLVPTTLAPGMTWTSSSLLTASSSWAFNVTWAHHGPLGTTGNSSTHQGGWNGSANVTLYGSTGGEMMFHDHVMRSEVLLALAGPFGLRDGFLLVPASFDVFSGAGHVYDSDALGTTAIASEGIFVGGGHLDVRSVEAAQADLGASVFGAAQTSSTSPQASVTATSSEGATVTAQPESPAQAQAQAACLQYGCAAPSGFGWAGVLVVGLVVAAGAGAAIVLTRRGKPGRPSAAPLPNAGPNARADERPPGPNA